MAAVAPDRSLRPLLRIARLVRADWALLGLGLVVVAAAAALLAGLALSAGWVAVAASAGLLLALRLTGAGRVVLRYGERLLTHRAMFAAMTTLRIWLFRVLARRSAGGLGFLGRGEALARLVGDVAALDGLYLRVLVPLAACAVLLPALMVALLPYAPVTGLGVALLFLAAAVACPLWAARAARGQGAALAEAAAGLRTATLDTLAGMREVRAFGNEGRMLAAVQAQEAALLAAQRRVAESGARAQALAGLCGGAATLSVLLSGLPEIHLLAALLLTLAAFEAAGAMPRAGALAGRMGAAAARILALEQVPAADEPASALALPAGTGLRLDSVTFAWPGRPPTFEGLDLEIPAGSRVAILGPSGAGKSTIAALLTRTVRPQAGRVLLGGVDTARLRAQDVRSRIAVLAQATHVFGDTVRGNLLLGRPEAAEPELWEALAQAGVEDVVRALPGGLECWIGEGGAGLSGGQARRIALARTLLSPAPILLLDEPATGLDDAAERAFHATLNQVAEGRTLILIVHRLLGTERLDRVWRLSNRRAVPATR